jgi:hypothetical protein
MREKPKKISFSVEINKKLNALKLKALKTKPGTKAQETIIKEIDSLIKLRDKFKK